MTNGTRILSECTCISQKDKDILLDALEVRKDMALNTYNRFQNSISLETRERVETTYKGIEKMIDAITVMPICTKQLRSQIRHG